MMLLWAIVVWLIGLAFLVADFAVLFGWVPPYDLVAATAFAAFFLVCSDYAWDLTDKIAKSWKANE